MLFEIFIPWVVLLLIVVLLALFSPFLFVRIIACIVSMMKDRS